MNIRENIDLLLHEIPPATKLVAVSKNQAVSRIQEAYDAGQRIFGENRVQELTAKQPLLTSDIEWHFIGHLQSNKIKYIVSFVKLIHSVDSLKLLVEIDKEAGRLNKIVDCLLQFYISTEDTKFGLDPEEARMLLLSPEYHSMKNIRITGVMGMATFTDDESIVRKEFRFLKDCFDTLSREFFRNEPAFREISMGMSGDYKLAIMEGSTMIRIGTGIFGER